MQLEKYQKRFIYFFENRHYFQINVRLQTNNKIFLII